MKNLKLSCLAIVAILAITSCSKDKVAEPVLENEVITTVITTLANASGNVVLTSKDADGDGPGAPALTQTGTIVAGRVYAGSVKFLNELVTPVEDVTLEVQTLGLEHQVFYQANATVGTFLYQDQDSAGKPIGLSFRYTAAVANATPQNLTVTLRHELNKSAAGVSAGNIANAAGSTDAEVTYRVVITP